jgi:gamma-glutamylcyclotransferase (GGCT)/AIG2-like uncharacterized protein YtfP
MMEQSNGQVFVYGSLRSGFHHPAYAYISRYFTLVSEGKVKGSLYDMGEYPAAIPSEKDQFIIGELYRINSPEEFEWAIAQLDDYEGCIQKMARHRYIKESKQLYIPVKEKHKHGCTGLMVIH